MSHSQISSEDSTPLATGKITPPLSIPQSRDGFFGYPEERNQLHVRTQGLPRHRLLKNLHPPRLTTNSGLIDGDLMRPRMVLLRLLEV